MTNYILAVMLVLAILLTHQSLVVSIAKAKGHQGIKPYLIGLIPVYGFMYYKKQEETIEPSEARVLQSLFKVKSILALFGLHVLLMIILFSMIAPILYQLLIVGIIVGFIILLTHESFVVVVAHKKGYYGLKPYFLGLVPLYGFIYYQNQEDISETDTEEDLEPLPIFTLKSCVIMYLKSTIKVMIAFAIIAPIMYQLLIPGIIVFLIIFFTHQSLVVSVAHKKGYYGIVPGFIGFIPVYGFFYYLNFKEAKRNVTKSSFTNIFTQKNVLGTMLVYTELVVLGFIVLVPIVYVIGASLSPTAALPRTIWPDAPTLDNFRFLLSGVGEYGGREVTTNFTAWYWNTLQIAFFTMIFAVLFITGTAYVFSRYNFKGKKVGLLAILVLQMFPSFLGLIAIFTLFQTFGLLDQPLALVVIYTAGAIPFNVWLIKGYLQSIPKELDESAKIDGASKLTIFFKIILPLSVPIISFVAVTQFMAPWMDYILPSFVIRSEENWTLAVGIFAFIDDQSRINYPAFAASALLVALPITIIYVTFQRYLIEGITAGANKG